MPNTKKTTEFLLTQITFSFTWCQSCNGSGIKSRTFRGQKFVNDCSVCKGTGRQKLTNRTEVPLLQALKELNLIK